MLMYRKEEDSVKIAIADYLNYKYPGIPFMMQWDHLRLSIGVAKKLKRMRCSISDFVWPDCFIAYQGIRDKYLGLFLEIKKNKDEVFNKKGRVRSSKQIQKELKSLKMLNDIGFMARFTWSLDHAMTIFMDYFGR